MKHGLMQHSLGVLFDIDSCKIYLKTWLCVLESLLVLKCEFMDINLKMQGKHDFFFNKTRNLVKNQHEFRWKISIEFRWKIHDFFFACQSFLRACQRTGEHAFVLTRDYSTSGQKGSLYFIFINMYQYCSYYINLRLSLFLNRTWNRNSIPTVFPRIVSSLE